MAEAAQSTPDEHGRWSRTDDVPQAGRKAWWCDSALWDVCRKPEYYVTDIDYQALCLAISYHNYGKYIVPACLYRTTVS